MKLPSKSRPYIIPEYSLTGDLLSFLTCNLQYRYQNKGTLPPSKPVQRWFGEFIHGVMEEAYLEWDYKKTAFPWDWLDDIRPIEEQIDLRLQTRGLYPYDEDLFFSMSNHPEVEYLNEHDHKKLASARAEKAINIWGRHLFPLIDSSEHLIKGVRPMPNYDEHKSRSNYYGINGVVDVLTSMKINDLEQSNLYNYDNLIIEFLKKDPNFKKQVMEQDGEDYEIIIDYKGMKRPPTVVSDPKVEDKWETHKQQILTYSWLLIKEELKDDLTDVGNEFENDVKLIENWEEDDKAPNLSDEFKISRSIRIINVDESEQDNALLMFDSVVENIESSLIKEMNGCKIQEAWKADSDERTCSACDFRTFCKNNSVKTKDIKIP